MVADVDKRLSTNPSHTFNVKQNKLLVSWLISTISGDLLSAFTKVTTACQIWNKALSLFTATSEAKVGRVKHDLHSIKKKDLSITDYLACVKSKCDVLSTSGHGVSETK